MAETAKTMDENAVLAPPSPLDSLREFGLPFDLARFTLQSPLLIGAQRGDGRPILLLPGYLASPRSMRPLRRYLTFLGYDARDWTLGRNMGQVEQRVAQLRNDLGQIFADRGDAPVTLIGWSLGGVIARELARVEPTRIAEVFTIASPIVGGPKYTSMARRFARRETVQLDSLEQKIDERNRLGLTQPVTAIYSDRDGIVGRGTALDRFNPQARNIRIDESHIGLGFSPRVWRTIADGLALSRVQ